MDIRLLNNPLQDSTSDVSQEISDLSLKLLELGIDFEVQGIGEPDASYLDYLKEMLLPVKDSGEGNPNKMSASSLSALIPQLDFPVSIDSDDVDYGDVDVEREEAFFTSEITAGTFKVTLFGSVASLTLTGYVRAGMHSHDYDVPDDPDEIEITGSDLTLMDVAGILVQDASGAPVVYLVGSADLEEMDGFTGFNASVVEAAPKENIPQFGDYNPTVMLAVDHILESYIGKQTYTAKSQL